MSKSLYFIAIIPPDEICKQVQVFRKMMADRYDSKHALKSPPHITLIPPFYWVDDRYQDLKLDLINWSLQKNAFTIELLNFSCFKPRVLYVDVLPCPALILLQAQLKEHCKTKWKIAMDHHHNFHPHMTIAFKDLKATQFYSAWNHLQKEHFSATFLTGEINILKYLDQKWQVMDHLLLQNIDDAPWKVR